MLTTVARFAARWRYAGALRRRGSYAMSLRLDGKTALITGGASGIGRAPGIRFAQEGANVFVADRQHAAAEETAAQGRKLSPQRTARAGEVRHPAPGHPRASPPIEQH